MAQGRERVSPVLTGGGAGARRRTPSDASPDVAGRACPHPCSLLLGHLSRSPSSPLQQPCGAPPFMAQAPEGLKTRPVSRTPGPSGKLTSRASADPVHPCRDPHPDLGIEGGLPPQMLREFLTQAPGSYPAPRPPLHEACPCADGAPASGNGTSGDRLSTRATFSRTRPACPPFLGSHCPAEMTKPLFDDWAHKRTTREKKQSTGARGGLCLITCVTVDMPLMTAVSVSLNVKWGNTVNFTQVCGEGGWQE